MLAFNKDAAKELEERAQRTFDRLGMGMEADGYERDGTPYIRTLQGERVKSLEECVIADWLFYNGVTYDYERRYEFDTATDTHCQYRPNFYYPHAGLYHEHFSLDADGQAPEQLPDYAEGMHWKRQQHAARGTALVEPPRLVCAVDTPCGIWRRGLASPVSYSTPTPTASCPSRAQSPCRTRT